MLKFDNRIQQFPYFELYRQIRIERSLAVSALVQDVVCALARWARDLALRGARLARSLAAERSRRRAIVELHRFDDRSLADMGLTRGAIESAVRSNGRPRHSAQAAKMLPKQRASAKRLPSR
jgi:uncharacterized protein YjiS (DUF1127 family)